VTLFAPAKNMFLATPAGSDTYRDARVRGGHASGTSWSAPVTAGFAARILQSNPTFTPVQVRTALLANTSATLDTATLNTFDHLGTLIPGTPNKLLRLGDVNITDQPDSTTSSGPTLLSVTAGGTSTLSYQWYQVNSGFDLATYNYGAHSSTTIAGATASTYTAPASSTTRAYWVRVTNAGGSADSDIAVVTPPLNPPANVNAVASGTSVNVTWSAVSGATGYQVQRKVTGLLWTDVGSPSATSFTDPAPPITDDGIAVYRVRATQGSAVSPYSLLDFAHPRAFTDSTILSNMTPIKAIHVIELRKAVNGMADAASLPAQYVGGDLLESSLKTPGRAIQAADFNDLLSRLNTVRTNPAYGKPPAAFPVPPAPGMVIFALQIITTLRGGTQ
jgi:hypothetical protein